MKQFMGLENKMWNILYDLVGAIVKKIDVPDRVFIIDHL